MTYKIISTNEKQTQISVELDGVEYTSLIVCNQGELDSAVAVFVDSIKNPKTFEPVPVVDVNTLIQEQQALITSLTARIAALEGTPA
jgi:hypothetical protein